jgi:hypothetical protein
MHHLLERLADLRARLLDDRERARADGLLRERRALRGERPQDDDRQRQHRHDLAQEGHAVHPRHLHVERHHVGPEPHEEVARLVRVRRGADDLEVGLRAQPAREDAADERGVVDDEDTDLRAHVDLR